MLANYSSGGGEEMEKGKIGREDLCERFLQAAEAAEPLKLCNSEIQLDSVKHGLPFASCLERSNEKPLWDKSSWDLNNETILLCFNVVIFKDNNELISLLEAGHKDKYFWSTSLLSSAAVLTVASVMLKADTEGS